MIAPFPASLSEADGLQHPISHVFFSDKDQPEPTFLRLGIWRMASGNPAFEHQRTTPQDDRGRSYVGSSKCLRESLNKISMEKLRAHHKTEACLVQRSAQIRNARQFAYLCGVTPSRVLVIETTRRDVSTTIVRPGPNASRRRLTGRRAIPPGHQALALLAFESIWNR